MKYEIEKLKFLCIIEIIFKWNKWFLNYFFFPVKNELLKVKKKKQSKWLKSDLISEVKWLLKCDHQPHRHIVAVHPIVGAYQIGVHTIF